MPRSVANDHIAAIVVMSVAPSTVLRLIDFQLESNLLVCIPICWPLFRSVTASTTEYEKEGRQKYNKNPLE